MFAAHATVQDDPKHHCPKHGLHSQPGWQPTKKVPRHPESILHPFVMEMAAAFNLKLASALMTKTCNVPAS